MFACGTLIYAFGAILGGFSPGLGILLPLGFFCSCLGMAAVAGIGVVLAFILGGKAAAVK